MFVLLSKLVFRVTYLYQDKAPDATGPLVPEVIIGHKGQSLVYVESSGSLLFIFLLALVVVYLVMAAQFESFVHPLVIMLTVPLAEWPERYRPIAATRSRFFS